MFIFFSFLTAKFWWKIEFDAQGQDGKLGKIPYFLPIEPFAMPSVMNGQIRYLLELLFCTGLVSVQFGIHQFVFTVWL